MHHPNHGTPAFGRRQPELPAFCRTRRAAANPVMVCICSLRALRNLLLLVLALKLSTLLLVLAGPVPAQLRAPRAVTSSGTGSVFRSAASAAVGAVPGLTPLSDR